MEGVEGRKGWWFWNNIEQVVGDGTTAVFWEDFLLGERTIKNMFPRLFHLSMKK